MRCFQFFMASVMAISTVGCCSVCNTCGVDPCGPYSNGPVIGGGILRFFSLPTSGSCCCQSGGCGAEFSDGSSMGNLMVNSGCSCGQCGYVKPYRPLKNLFARHSCRGACVGQSCDCDGMMVGSASGCGGCGSPMNNNYGVSSGCGCGANHAVPGMNYESPSTVPSVPTPAPPPPLKADPQPGSTPETSSNMNPSMFSSQTKMVSYEEFQKLPGTIISGPGAVSPMSSANADSASRVAQQPRQITKLAGTTLLPSTPSQTRQAAWSPATH